MTIDNDRGIIFTNSKSERNSAGRVLASQAKGRGFESRRSLFYQILKYGSMIAFFFNYSRYFFIRFVNKNVVSDENKFSKFDQLNVVLIVIDTLLRLIIFRITDTTKTPFRFLMNYPN